MTIIDENEIARCVRRAVEDYLKDLGWREASSIIWNGNT